MTKYTQAFYTQTGVTDMSFTIQPRPNYKLKKAFEQSTQNNWNELSTNRNRKIMSDSIYAYVSQRDNKNGNKVSYVTIYIGEDIAQKLNFKAKDRIVVYTHNSDPYFLQLKKSTSTRGHIISKVLASKTLSLSFSMNRINIIQEKITTPVDYEVVVPSTLLVDLESLTIK